MARRSLRIEAKRQDKMKPGSGQDSDFSFSSQSPEDVNSIDGSSSNKGNGENFAIRIQLGGKVKPYAVKRSQMKSLRKSKLRLPSKKIPKGSQDSISQMELSEHEIGEDPSNLPALIVTELSSSSKPKEYVLPSVMPTLENEESPQKGLKESGDRCGPPEVQIPNQDSLLKEKSIDWKEMRDENRNVISNSDAPKEVGKAAAGKDESEDKVVRDLQEFLQLGGERRQLLKPIDNIQPAGLRIVPVQGKKKPAQKPYTREPPVIVVKKVPEGKEKETKAPEEPMKKVPDITKSARQITGKERETYLRDMKDSILRDLNPLVLKTLVNQRCGETRVDFSPSKFFEHEPQPTNWSKYLTGEDTFWTDTEKYQFKSVFKDIKSSIESFEGASGSANETNKFDINEMEMNKAPKRMYRKKMGDEKLEAWYQYNLYKSLQLPEEARRKAESEAWMKASSAASISLELQESDSANMGFIESRSIDSMANSLDYTFETSEILGSSTPINQVTAQAKHFVKHYASFNTSEL